jgi:hypothetical protein
LEKITNSSNVKTSLVEHRIALPADKTGLIEMNLKGVLIVLHPPVDLKETDSSG